MPLEKKSALLAIGYGQEWEQQKRRTHRLLLLGLAANGLTLGVAVFAWASVVTRELPVVALTPSDTGVCEQWRAFERSEWSEVQVSSWVTTLAKAAMVQDSRLVKEHLQLVTTMLAPALRAEFRRTESMRERFAEIAKMNVRGELVELTIDCGDNPRFVSGAAPWYCIAYGGAEYRPARARLSRRTPAVKSYFFIELAIQPGEVALQNPLGLEAVEFLPREAESKEELSQLVAEERL